MDFMSYQLFDGRPIRILTIVDIHTREGLSTTSRANFRAAQVVEVLDQLVRVRGKPKSLRVDNGPEFAGRLLDHWAHLNKVEIDFSRPGKPTDCEFTVLPGEPDPPYGLTTCHCVDLSAFRAAPADLRNVAS